MGVRSIGRAFPVGRLHVVFIVTKSVRICSIACAALNGLKFPIVSKDEIHGLCESL